MQFTNVTASSALRVIDSHFETDSSTWGKLCSKAKFARSAAFDDVVGNSIGYIFIEGRSVAKASEIEFETLGLDTELIRDVFEREMSKIGLLGNWTERGKFGAIELNPVITTRMTVFEGLK